MDPATTLTFRGAPYYVPVGGDRLIKVNGPWPQGRKSFRARSQESLEQFHNRIEQDAVEAEVLLRYLCPLACRCHADGALFASAACAGGSRG